MRPLFPLSPQGNLNFVAGGRADLIRSLWQYSVKYGVGQGRWTIDSVCHFIEVHQGMRPGDVPNQRLVEFVCIVILEAGM